jgi:hypothetical protein
MQEYERRELQVPSDQFEFTKEGELVVKSDRIKNAFREVDVDRARAGEVTVGVVVSRSF